MALQSALPRPDDTALTETGLAATGEGRVLLIASRLDDEIRLEISDNGPGIPEDLRERIFDPFFSTKTSSGGMGLGLAISMRLAEDLGGNLSVRADTPKGAVFELTLPAIESGAARSNQSLDLDNEAAE